MTDWHAIATAIAAAGNTDFHPGAPQPLAGGCINRAYELSDGRQRWFVKLNQARLLPMFQAEAEGLDALAAHARLRVPRPLCSGVAASKSYLVLEYLDLGGPANPVVAGQQLAELHRHGAARFGWHRDNWIGATPQPNAWNEDWIGFWRDQRLGHQLALAQRQGYGATLLDAGERLLERLPALLDHAPQPSLLHGDLWAGNLAFTSAGEPAIFDPATYYGDREAEIAMTELFRGFPPDFYAAYREAWPLDPGYRVRRDLYNLYQVLNHLNLFGGGYLEQAQRLLQRLLAVTAA